MSTSNAMQMLMEKLYTTTGFFDMRMCRRIYKAVIKTQKEIVLLTKGGAIVNTLNRIFGFERVYVGF